MNADDWRIVGLGSVSYLLCALVVPLARRAALARGIMDHPRQGRWHKAPTPYLGGAAIAAAAVVCSAFAPGWQLQAGVLFAAAAVVGAVGLVDDIRNVHPGLRLLTEALAAGDLHLTAEERRTLEELYRPRPVDLGQ